MDRRGARLFEEFDDSPRAPRAPEAGLDVIVRAGRMDDADPVAHIAARREGGDPATEAAALRRALASEGMGNSRILLVAECEGAVVGFGKAQYRDADSPREGGLPEGWYLTGVVVDPAFRRRGIGTRLTEARLRWIAERATAAYYFANAGNRVSIALHEHFGFVEIARASEFGGATFVGGEGVLFRAELAGARELDHAD